MDEASSYHYQALMLCERSSNKTTFIAKKNRVMSLSGIGNVYLTLDNLDAADSIFRVTLAGEQELHSDLGQAMNYANLGSVFETRGMIDSALVYYQLSMEHNRKAHSDLGISLCHNHFGRLFALEGKWNDALREYRNAYDLMEKQEMTGTGSKRVFHWFVLISRKGIFALQKFTWIRLNEPLMPFMLGNISARCIA